MEFAKYFLEQINRHPSVQPQDIVKICYQAAYGAEHLLSDLSAAENYLKMEYEETKAEDIALFESISDHVCRVNLAGWKFRRLPLKWLFRMFAASASVKNSSKDVFLDYLQTAEEILKRQSLNFSFADWQAYLSDYKRAGMTAVHHSGQYRKCEKPAYRIVDSQYIRLFPILEKAAKEIQKEKVCVLAIDGRAASGKSTIAKQLKMILDADIIRIDDFFLPLELRTQERFQTPGGNVHYERFIKEVLPYISLQQSFSYRIFDCSQMDYNGEQLVENTRFRIVEGSYSCHPKFGDYADITVFSDVKPDEQMSRICQRDGEKMAERFRNEWIPMEEAYFEHYRIIETAEIKVGK